MGRSSIHRGAFYNSFREAFEPSPPVEFVVVEDRPSDFDAKEINVDDTFLHFSSLENKLPALHAELGEDSSLVFDDDLEIAFHRTLRMPDDNRLHQLPQSLGYFPLYNVEAFSSRLPDRIVERGGVFFSMWQREAMWIEFKNKDLQRKYAIRINLGKVNAVSGLRITEVSTKQDYVVVPGQPWLDGIAIGPGVVRQFVAMPLGKGYTVEGQVTGEEKFGGLQIEVVPSYDDIGKKEFARKGEFRELAESRTPRFCCLKPGDRVTMRTIGASPRFRYHQVHDVFDESVPAKDRTHVTLQAKYRDKSAVFGPTVPSRLSARLEDGETEEGSNANTLHGTLACPVPPAGMSVTEKLQQDAMYHVVQTWQKSAETPESAAMPEAHEAPATEVNELPDASAVLNAPTVDFKPMSSFSSGESKLLKLVSEKSGNHQSQKPQYSTWWSKGKSQETFSSYSGAPAPPLEPEDIGTAPSPLDEQQQSSKSKEGPKQAGYGSWTSLEAQPLSASAKSSEPQPWLNSPPAASGDGQPTPEAQGKPYIVSRSFRSSEYTFVADTGLSSPHQPDSPSQVVLGFCGQQVMSSSSPAGNVSEQSPSQDPRSKSGQLPVPVHWDSPDTWAAKRSGDRDPPKIEVSEVGPYSGGFESIDEPAARDEVTLIPGLVGGSVSSIPASSSSQPGDSQQESEEGEKRTYARKMKLAGGILPPVHDMQASGSMVPSEAPHVRLRASSACAAGLVDFGEEPREPRSRGSPEEDRSETHQVVEREEKKIAEVLRAEILRVELERERALYETKGVKVESPKRSPVMDEGYVVGGVSMDSDVSVMRERGHGDEDEEDSAYMESDLTRNSEFGEGYGDEDDEGYMDRETIEMTGTGKSRARTMQLNTIMSSTPSAEEEEKKNVKIERRVRSLARGTFGRAKPKEKDPEIQSLREMGLAAGGRLIQDIYRDSNPPWIWNRSRSRMLNVHIFNSWTFEAITHIMAPPTPITAEHYTELGLPFFVIEEERDQRIDGGDALKEVKSVSAMDKKVGLEDAALNQVEPGICKGCSIRLTDCM
ncbi:MAG: hypothetical protein M1823_001352 [Watsoniomyces obsoletus]|nr:MAG: hypothetical protein M1823_001352 [Watsoniomyces obsoletus]